MRFKIHRYSFSGNLKCITVSLFRDTNEILFYSWSVYYEPIINDNTIGMWKIKKLKN